MPTDDGPSDVVGGFLKSKSEMVVAYIQPYSGRQYAHLRIMVPSAEEEGEWVHTKKGISVGLELVPSLVDAIERLRSVASPNKVVATLPLTRDQIRVGTNTFKGEQYVYVRRFYQSEGEWRPTARGISIHSDRLDDLVDLSQQLREASAESG